MNPRTIERLVPGPAGQIETAWSLPGEPPRGIALVAHPHPMYGGAMDNKVGVIGILEAVEELLAEGYEPHRTLYLAFGHDEESWAKNRRSDIVYPKEPQ